MMPSEDAMRGPWTARLEVFEQDFDTAMAIWSIEDDVVARLCADEAPLTRRRSQLSSSQVELTQLSECSQRDTRPSKARKRRRTAVESEERGGRDAPPPPLRDAASLNEQTQDVDSTQPLSLEDASQVDVIPDELETIGLKPSTIAREDCSSAAQEAGTVDIFKTPTNHRRAGTRELMLADQASPFSRTDVVRESPLDCPSTGGKVGSTLRHPVGETTAICSGFTTGSGRAAMVSKKRLREVEADWNVSQVVSVLGDNMHTTSSQKVQRLQGDSTSVSSLCVQDSSAVIDPRRLSFSTLDDATHGDGPGNVSPGSLSGRHRQLDRGSLVKHEALRSTQVNFNEGAMLQFSDSENVEELTGSTPANGFTDCAQAGKGTCGRSFDLSGGDGCGKAMTSFQTGTGRPVAVSRERLSQYANTILVEQQQHRSSNESDPDAARSPEKRNQPSLSRNSPNSELTPCSGFQTASGRNVVISEERLKEFQERLFGEDHAREAAKRDDNMPRRWSTGSEAADRALDEFAYSRSDARPDEAEEPQVVLSGIHTGSGKSIEVSRERLRMYESRVLPDVEDPSIAQHSSSNASKCLKDTPTATVLSGFTTGSGGQVTVSKERLQLYERMLRDDDQSDPTAYSKNTVPQEALHPVEEAIGFQTASGQKLTISEEKLREYARKFKEDNQDDETHCIGVGVSEKKQAPPASANSSTTVFSGFATGTGQPVAISAGRLRHYESELIKAEEKSSQCQRNSGWDSHSQEKHSTQASRSQGSSDGAAVVLAGFTTGNGQSVSVSEDTLREYQAKISQAYDDAAPSLLDKGDGGNLVDQVHIVKTTPVNTRRDIGGNNTQGRPPRHRHSLGSVNTSVGIHSTTRRQSLPPILQTKKADESNGTSVSSGVIQRLAIAHQRNSRPPVLDDVSNVPKRRPRVSGLGSGGGKWKPPSQLQDSHVQGYSTPAKMKTAAPQSLSAKKGFRPPIPSKTPPSKALLAPTMTTPQTSTPVKAAPVSTVTDWAPQITMRFREAMRISYRLLAPDTGVDAHSFTSETRVKQLLRICPENAPAVVFSEDDGELIEQGDSNAIVSMTDIEDEMKRREFVGSETIVTKQWFRNQYRWSVWKLATMELQAPRFLFARYLNKNQVMYEMCKRYQRDVVLAQRSILKKILNRDANAASCMVLRVAAVLPFPVEEEKDIDIIPPPHWKLSVVLTDGWHGVYAVPDAHLAEAFWKHHKANRLIGKKIATWSALLQNTNDGIDPLECALATEMHWSNPLWAGKDDPSRWSYLKLHFNSTRSVRADTKLGLEALVRPALGRHSDAPYDFVLLKSVPMRTLEVGGGVVRSVCVRVTRLSPVLHLQPKDFSIGPRILCDEYMPQYFQARQDHLQGQRDEGSGGEEDLSTSMPMPVPFVKMEVECAHDPHSQRKCYAVLTVWRPGDEMLSKLKEGGAYYATSLSVNWKVDYGHQGVFLRVGTAKGSTFEPVGLNDEKNLTVSSRVCETVDGLIQRYQQHVMTMPKEKKLYGDVCVVIVKCESAKAIERPPETSFATSTDHVFAVDRTGRILSVRLHTTRVFKPSTSAGSQLHDNSSSRKKTPERVFTRGNKKLWTEGNVVCLSGLEVSHYDDKLGVLDCDLVESAQIVSLPSKKSHFFAAAQSLREILACKDGSVSGANELALSIQTLRKYIERTILHQDFVPSQDDNDDSASVGYSNEEEAEYLTQELHGQPEDDVSYWMSQAPSIHVEGAVVKMLPLQSSDPLSGMHGIEAVIYVRANSEEVEETPLHAVYATGDILDKIRECDASLNDMGVHACANTVQDRVLRFEAQWETSERLLNSWKPWERDGGATFLLATAVSMAHSTDS